MPLNKKVARACYKIHQWISDSSRLHQIRFRGSAPDPAGETQDAPPDPLVGWGGGYPLPIPYPLDAFGVSVSSPTATRPPSSLNSPPVQGRIDLGGNVGGD